jgi:hypothetical protein
MYLVTDKNSSDSEIDSGIDTEYVESFMPIFFPYWAGNWTDVFEVDCTVKFPGPTNRLKATSRGAPIIVNWIYVGFPSKYDVCFISLGVLRTDKSHVRNMTQLAKNKVE